MPILRQILLLCLLAAPLVSTVAVHAQDNSVEPYRENATFTHYSSTTAPLASAAKTMPPSIDLAQQNLHKPIFNLDRRQHQKTIAITIDDGPSPYTAEILKILQQQQIPATFFLIAGGEKSAQEARLIRAAGNTVGNHTVHHKKLSRLSPEQQQEEIIEATKTLAEAGTPVTLIRPPYGTWNSTTTDIASKLNQAVVLWDVDSRDWALRKNPRRIIRNVLAGVKDGSIILLHERRQTSAVLPELLKALKARGYSFVALR